MKIWTYEWGKQRHLRKFLRSKKRYNVYTIKLRLGDEEEDQEGEYSVKHSPGRQMTELFWEWGIISSSNANNKTVKQ